ncbi:MAG: hypothetical protein WKF40_09200 [Thermoleophilaceae bacterium]
MLRMQRWVPRLRPRPLRAVVALMCRRRLTSWAFRHYLDIAPPDQVGPPPAAGATPQRTPERAAA